MWHRSTGAGVTVAVIDTGVNAAHPELAGAVLPGWQFTGAGVISHPGGTTDPLGHGTTVASVIAAARNGQQVVGVAPGARILPVKVIDVGWGWSSDVARGVNWAVDNGAQVVNVSLASSAPEVSLGHALERARAAGVLVVAGGGNTGECGLAAWPAAHPDALAVAAISRSGGWASFSTTGDYIDLAAPGDSVMTITPDPASTSGFAISSGTSMSSPHVAGVAALLWAAHPDWDAEQVRAALVASAVDVAPRGTDAWTGAGSLDAVAALDWAPPTP